MTQSLICSTTHLAWHSLTKAAKIFFAKRKIVHSSSSSPGSEVQKVPALAIILNNVIESENVFFASKGKVRGRGQMVISRLRHEELLVVRVLNQRCITTMNPTFEKRTNWFETHLKQVKSLLRKWLSRSWKEEIEVWYKGVKRSADPKNSRILEWNNVHPF